MRILILSWRGPKNPRAGGAEIATHEHAKAWVKGGHKVVLLTSMFKGGSSREMIDGVEVVRMGGEVFGVKLRAFWWYCFGKNEKFDLVIDEIHGMPFFTPLYVREKKLCYIHEVAKDVWKYNPWVFPFNLIPYVFGTIFEPLLYRLIYKNQKFMTVSNSTKKDLVKWGINEKNIMVVHNGVTTMDFRRKKEKERTFIYLGALTKDKGVEDAINAFSLMVLNNPTFKLWVVGRGEEKFVVNLKKEVGKLKIEKNVKFWGFVSDRKKYELLGRAHVLINLSVREGWGLVNIEANSVGTPVVGYEVPGLVDSVVNGKTGILVKKGMISDLAQSVIELVQNKRRYMQMSRAAIKWSKSFTWSSSTQESSSFIQKL